VWIYWNVDDQIAGCLPHNANVSRASNEKDLVTQRIVAPSKSPPWRICPTQSNLSVEAGRGTGVNLVESGRIFAVRACLFTVDRSLRHRAEGIPDEGAPYGDNAEYGCRTAAAKTASPDEPTAPKAFVRSRGVYRLLFHR
jgi:hypothetical protein